MADHRKISPDASGVDYRVPASDPVRLLMMNSTPVDIFGGVEQWMLRSSLGLIRRGHIVHAMGRPKSQFLARLGKAGIPVHHGCRGMDYSPVEASQIARIARGEMLEIAIVNFNKELTQAARAKARSPIKKIISRSVLPMFDTSPKHRRLYQKYLDGVITPSREVKRVIESFDWMAGTAVQNIPNGLDLAKVDQYQGGRGPVRQSMGYSADNFIIGAVGRLEAHKGINHLIAAFGLAARDLEHAVLIIAGNGSREQELRHQAASMGAVGERIRFTGYIEDIYQLMTTFDLLVLPSTTEYETFGQVLIEAMAFRIPLIGSKVGGIPEVITDGSNGFLVPPGDRTQLADRIIRLANDGSLRRAMARDGRRRVEENYTEPMMLDRLESYLLNIIRTP
ncbi:glycosyltransferase family 4 protein [Candidatus Zixiibacteriota bacterium]